MCVVCVCDVWNGTRVRILSPGKLLFCDIFLIKIKVFGVGGKAGVKVWSVSLASEYLSITLRTYWKVGRLEAQKQRSTEAQKLQWFFFRQHKCWASQPVSQSASH